MHNPESITSKNEHFHIPPQKHQKLLRAINKRSHTVRNIALGAVGGAFLIASAAYSVSGRESTTPSPEQVFPHGVQITTFLFGINLRDVTHIDAGTQLMDARTVPWSKLIITTPDGKTYRGDQIKAFIVQTPTKQDDQHPDKDPRKTSLWAGFKVEEIINREKTTTEVKVNLDPIYTGSYFSEKTIPASALKAAEKNTFKDPSNPHITIIPGAEGRIIGVIPRDPPQPGKK